MAGNGIPPFRADHVGSLLRPAALMEARDKQGQGEITAEELRAVEDEHIRAAVTLQEEIGLEAITDGEFRRQMFHMDFLKELEGAEVKSAMPVKFHNEEGEKEFAPPRLVVEGRLRRTHGIQTEDFKFLRSVTSKMPKVCIPSPPTMHFRGGRAAVSEEAYPEIEEFFDDLARVYREEIAELGRLGLTYLQLDEVNLAYLCDPALRQRAKDIGEDPETLPHTYAKLINESVRDRPEGMTVAMHLCRGNYRSSWVSEGGYGPVAETLFNAIDMDAYFLEYDSPRAGDFSPLRFVPKGKKVVLGLVTSKKPDLEEKDELKRRIDEAAGYVPMEDLALSPQCGFASTAEGNELSVDAQRAKLELVVEVAREVWG
ncbi:MAG: 5-methyltetrahydropteroyltriglutamate--homocysteine S-methyltransferase [Rhodospirillales bacterium]|nr:5-methyltetrahydropteroyltriglutamate--homocysteine S-methyltransferase [Rhodospirillales bacterium]MDP6772802.1 5-methyltetrahydropteroyltriglutamate--homocysteine S-methyltransferase [Rhodospirillales bacterium]